MERKNDNVHQKFILSSTLFAKYYENTSNEQCTRDCSFLNDAAMNGRRFGLAGRDCIVDYFFTQSQSSKAITKLNKSSQSDREIVA